MKIKLLSVLALSLTSLAVITANAKTLSVPGWTGASPKVDPAALEEVSATMGGMFQPPALDGRTARLAPGRMVVGVKVGSCSRAYAMPSMKLQKSGQDFLIRDKIDSRSVTLAFSGRDGQIVAFEWKPDGKRVRIPFRVTSWQDWKQTNPRTQLVIGETEMPGGVAANVVPSSSST